MTADKFHRTLDTALAATDDYTLHRGDDGEVEYLTRTWPSGEVELMTRPLGPGGKPDTRIRWSPPVTLRPEAVTV